MVQMRALLINIMYGRFYTQNYFHQPAALPHFLFDAMIENNIIPKYVQFCIFVVCIAGQLV